MARRQRYVEEPLVVSVAEAARLLGISSWFAWQLVRRGEIRSLRLGRRVLVPRFIVEQLVGRYDESEGSLSSRLDTTLQQRER